MLFAASAACACRYAAPSARMQCTDIFRPRGLQARELAAGDDRSGGLSGGGAAGRLKRHCECRVRREATGEIGRDGEADRLRAPDETRRTSPVGGDEEPQLAV